MANGGILSNSIQMPDQPQNSAKEFIDNMRSVDRCKWCGNDARKNGTGLCRPCNDVRKQVERLEKYAGTRSDVEWELELEVARAKRADCVSWGEQLKPILNGPVDSSLAAECQFSEMARKIAGKDAGKELFRGMANTFDLIFTPEQCRVLAYLFWEVFRSEASRNRDRRAHARVHPSG
jgi:hypothetical protein